MKKIFLAAFILLFAASSLFGMRAGLTQVVDPTRPQTALGAKSVKFALAYLDTEIREGRFVLKSIQRDTLSPVVHQRYQQLAGGLPVWGGEIILHMRNGKAESCDGEYFLLPSRRRSGAEADEAPGPAGRRGRPEGVRTRNRRRAERRSSSIP